MWCFVSSELESSSRDFGLDHPNPHISSIFALLLLLFLLRHTEMSLMVYCQFGANDCVGFWFGFMRVCGDGGSNGC